MKTAIRILLALAVLIVVLLLICVRPIERTPYDQTGYYRQTLAELAAKPPLAAKRAPLLAGIAKAGITPPVGVPLAGFGARKSKPSTGVHDSLYVRVIALQAGEQRACLIGYDALLIHPDLARTIEKRSGLKAEQLYFTASHTHSGPGGWGNGVVEEQFSGKPDPRVSTVLVDSTAAALQAALSTLKPATWRSGRLHAAEYIRNRLLGSQAPVDDELVYLWLESAEKPLALFAPYSAHATVLSEKNLQFSADYPGYLERRVEQTTGALTLFAAAGLGSHSHRGQGEGFERARYIGEGLADSLIRHAWAAPSRDSVALSYDRLAVAPPLLQIRLNRDYRLNAWLARRLLHFQDCYISLLALDEFRFLGAPVEFSGQLALQVKAAAAQQGKPVSVTSFNGCYLGYVVPSRYDELDAYETRTMCWFGPYFGDYLAEVMRRLAEW